MTTAPPRVPILTRLSAEDRSPGAARRVVQDALMRSGLEVVLDDALLLVTELVTNAVVHAGTEVELQVEVGVGGVRIEVVDHGAGAPPLLTAAPAADREGGRGIFLLDKLAQGGGRGTSPAASPCGSPSASASWSGRAPARCGPRRGARSPARRWCRGCWACPPTSRSASARPSCWGAAAPPVRGDEPGRRVAVRRDGARLRAVGGPRRARPDGLAAGGRGRAPDGPRGHRPGAGRRAGAAGAAAAPAHRRVRRPRHRERRPHRRDRDRAGPAGG